MDVAVRGFGESAKISWALQKKSDTDIRAT